MNRETREVDLNTLTLCEIEEVFNTYGIRFVISNGRIDNVE